MSRKSKGFKKPKVKKVVKPIEISRAEALIRAARPNFLLLTVSIMFMVFAIAHYLRADFSTTQAVLIILVGLLSHLAVNWLNEYQDFQSGLDLITDKTPFSGGSGALPAQPASLKWVKVAAFVSLIGVVLMGSVLVWLTGIELLLFGLLGIVIILTYTQYLTQKPWLCLIVPGLAFGPIMMLGSYYVLSGELSFTVLILSMVPFFLVNNLLLLNQIPDMEADKKVGRYNVLMLLGLEDGIQLFAAFNWLAFISLGVAYWWFDLPDYVALGFVSLLIVFPMLRKLQLDFANPKKLTPVLTMNVIISIVTPALIGIGFIIA